MIELNSKLIMSEPFNIIFILTLVIFFIVLWVGILQFAFGTRSFGENMIALSFGILILIIAELTLFPREIKEIHCVFTGTVNMSEIQTKYKIKSVNDDGVFTLLERVEYGDE